MIVSLVCSDDALTLTATGHNKIRERRLTMMRTLPATALRRCYSVVQGRPREHPSSTETGTELRCEYFPRTFPHIKPLRKERKLYRQPISWCNSSRTEDPRVCQILAENCVVDGNEYYPDLLGVGCAGKVLIELIWPSVQRPEFLCHVLCPAISTRIQCQQAVSLPTLGCTVEVRLTQARIRSLPCSPGSSRAAGCLPAASAGTGRSC